MHYDLYEGQYMDLLFSWQFYLILMAIVVMSSGFTAWRQVKGFVDDVTGSVHHSPNYYLEKATQQSNQRRIALITIMVALCGYLANEIEFSEDAAVAQSFGVLFSALSALAGMLAWSFSGQFFYLKGRNKPRKSANFKQKFADGASVRAAYCALFSSTVFKFSPLLV